PCAATSRAPPAGRRRARPRRGPRLASARRGRPRAARTPRAPSAQPTSRRRSRGRRRRHVRPHLCRAGGGRRTARRPLERLLETPHVEHVVAAGLFFRLGKGAVLYAALPVVLPHLRRRARRLDAWASDHATSVAQRL